MFLGSLPARWQESTRGSRNLKSVSKSYPEKYAIAVRDSGDLFLIFEINRSSKGDVYVNFNDRDSKHMPHSSYHASGQLHHKSYNRKLFPPIQKQPLIGTFTGSGGVITTSIQRGDARAWNSTCIPTNYQEIMEIKDEIITPEFGYQVFFELIEPNTKPWVSTYPYANIVQQHLFKDNSPWIVVSLYEMTNFTSTAV